MKSYKVQVDDSKAVFFKELLDSLGFVKFEEVDGFHEPRVYPGGNFEIRAQSTNKQQVISQKAKPVQQSDDAMRNLRDAMKAIEQQRDKNRQG